MAKHALAAFDPRSLRLVLSQTTARVFERKDPAVRGFFRTRSVRSRHRLIVQNGKERRLRSVTQFEEGDYGCGANGQPEEHRPEGALKLQACCHVVDEIHKKQEVQNLS